MKLIGEIFFIVFCCACDNVLGKIQYSGGINGILIDYYPLDGELKPIPEIAAGQRSVKVCDYVMGEFVGTELSNDNNGGAVLPGIGVPTELKEFSHMAAIGWTNPSGKIEYDCGGTLITKNFVLTAAHCTSRATIPPDVVRLGDINLESQIDDKYAQHIQIAEIIRHPDYKFSSKYNDIALLRLKEAVRVSEIVLPACLSTKKEIEYEHLMAAGWGNTGFSQKKSDILLKFRLAPVALENCSESYNIDRSLLKGLVNHQFCAVDSIMDTCEGDSGGPLEIKLAMNYRSIPFVVGVTSFGAACGLGTPGVYTKIASFIPWIESKVNTSFNPHDCANRHLRIRKLIEFPVTRVLDKLTSEHLANIGSITSNNNFVLLCGGSLITEDYIVTSASGLGTGQPPSVAEMGTGSYIQRIGIKRIIKHPDYNAATKDNNIALVQLEKNAEFNIEVFPTCVWPRRRNEDNITGWKVIGRAFDYLSIDSSTYGQSVRDFELNTFFYDNATCLRKDMKPNEFCAGFQDQYLVPELCDIKNGTALRSLVHLPDHNLYNYIFGIYSHGKDCGFGKPAIYTDLSPYLDWMDSVMFNRITEVPGRNIQVNDEIVFFDD